MYVKLWKESKPLAEPEEPDVSTLLRRWLPQRNRPNGIVVMIEY